MKKINPKDHAQRLTTTLNRLKDAGACEDRYKHLVKALGGVVFDHDKPINLLTILETNGVDDCLWALCATVENCHKVARLMAADFAEVVLPIYEHNYPNDDRPRKAIEATRRFALGKIGVEAWCAAGDAAEDAAWAAGDAAWAAGAARAAACAARAAAWAAGDAAWAAGAARDAACASRAAACASRDAAWAARAAAWTASKAAGDAAWDAQAEIIRAYLLP
jgi:hypothetical protein